MATQGIGQAGRWAPVTLALVLFALTGFVLWGNAATSAASSRAKSASELNDAYQSALFAVGQEESLERKYRLEPGPEVRAKYEVAQTAFATALKLVATQGTAADKALVADLMTKQASYLDAIERMFAAVDVGDVPRVHDIDAEEVDPLFDAILPAVDTAALDHHERALRELANLQRTERLVFRTTPVAFAIALGFLMVIWNVLRVYRRQIDDALRQESAREIKRVEERAAAERDAIRRSESRFRALVQHGADLITVVGADGAILYQSPSSASVLGYDPEELVGRSFTELVHPDSAAVARWLTEGAGRRAGDAVAAELKIQHKSGNGRTIETVATLLPAEATLDGVLLTSHDVTERKALEEQLRHQAFHDPLTALPNRALFLDRIGHALARAARTADPLAVLFLDLDEFKVVNDSLGHNAGDDLLTAVAARVRNAVRPGDTVARLGGDEFTVLLEETDLGNAIEVAERIGECLREPISLDGHLVVVRASIGIACKTSPEDLADDLLRGADVAMYVAKQKGKGRYAVYEPTMRERAWERLELEAELRRALTNDELRVYYQPIVDLATGQITEVEALVRWAHPLRSLVPPGEFIPLAEQTGLISSVGAWVLEQACRQRQAWVDAYPQASALTVSVNLSPRQFQDPALVEEVARILAATGLDPAHLRLELTENVMMEQGKVAITTLRALKNIGVLLALDDFGTGYSSLAYLQDFPIDVLKIDRSFVSRLGQGTEGQAIVRTIVGLARSLALAVVAEGVETSEQLEELRALGCNRGQGYFFARPLPAPDLFDLLVAMPNWGLPAGSPIAATAAANGHRPEHHRAPSMAARVAEFPDQMPMSGENGAYASAATPSSRG